MPYYNIDNIDNSKLLFDNFVFFCSPRHSLLGDFIVSEGHEYPLVLLNCIYYTPFAFKLIIIKELLYEGADKGKEKKENKAKYVSFWGALHWTNGPDLFS